MSSGQTNLQATNPPPSFPVTLPHTFINQTLPTGSPTDHTHVSPTSMEFETSEHESREKSPSVTPPSFKDKLVTPSILVPGLAKGRDLIGEGLVRIKKGNGPFDPPRVDIDQSIVQELASQWTKCVVVKLLGRFLTFETMEKRVRALWQPRGQMTFIDMVNGFYLACFDLEADHDRVLSDGPWTIFGHYLTVRRWRPEFNPKTSALTSTLIWVRISGLPMFLYDGSILTSVASSIENLIKMDNTITLAQRGRFARICVEMDLSQPLSGVVIMNGESYQVEYEGLDTICFHCGRYGHQSKVCLGSPCPGSAPPAQSNTDSMRTTSLEIQAIPTVLPLMTPRRRPPLR